LERQGPNDTPHASLLASVFATSDVVSFSSENAFARSTFANADRFANRFAWNESFVPLAATVHTELDQLTTATPSNLSASTGSQSRRHAARSGYGAELRITPKCYQLTSIRRGQHSSRAADLGRSSNPVGSRRMGRLPCGQALRGKPLPGQATQEVMTNLAAHSL